MVELSDGFVRYSAGESAVPIWCVTPGKGGCIHRFFDTSPFSPSGRYLAVFRMPFEDRLPVPGDIGEVLVIDLQSGVEHVVATTAGWESQLGCNLNWGSDDRTLVFNDVEVSTWEPRVVKLDWPSGQRSSWPGGVYQVSLDGRYAAAASMQKMRRTQKGYGVVVPDDHVGRNVGVAEDDGLFITDLASGERRLVLSLAEAARHIPELAGLSGAELAAWEVYGFHTKWNAQGDRLIFTVRRYLHEGQDRFDAFARRHGRDGPMDYVRFDVLTLKPDGSEVHNAVPAEFWTHGGHHINFFPDGQKLSMNLGRARERGLDLVQVSCDGSQMKKIIEGIDGSGHPTVHPDGRHILTDTYLGERWTRGDQTPLRWIDIEARTQRQLGWIATRPAARPDSALRVDPHPAWDRAWRWVAFNAVGGGVRRVYVADLSELSRGLRE